MNNSQFDQQIFSACKFSVGARDFTDAEKRYILENETFLEELLLWFESSNSDGCFTEESANFMRCFYDKKEILRLRNFYGIFNDYVYLNLEEIDNEQLINLNLQVSGRQIATMLASLRLFQRQSEMTSIAELFPEHFNFGNITPLSIVEIDQLCEQINVLQGVDIDLSTQSFHGVRYSFEISYSATWFEIVAIFLEDGRRSTIGTLNEILSAFEIADDSANAVGPDWEGTPEEVLAWVDTACGLFRDDAFVQSLEQALDRDRQEGEWETE
jgi:hypothetical protein